MEHMKELNSVYLKSHILGDCIFTGTFDECEEYCENLGWEFTDENEFVWGLEIV